MSVILYSGVPGAGVGGSAPPAPKLRRPSKVVPNSIRLWKLLKIDEFRTPTPQEVRKKGSKILKLPSVRNCFTLAMTNKLVVMINSLKVPKIKKILLYEMKFLVDSSWNMMAHGDAPKGKWRGNWRMQWVASTLHTTSEHGVYSITTALPHNSAASSRLNWRPPSDLNGLVRFAERPNLVSARVPSRFKRAVPNYSCLQNPWLGGYRPQIPVLSVLSWFCWTPLPPEQNFWVRHWYFVSCAEVHTVKIWGGNGGKWRKLWHKELCNLCSNVT